MGKQRAARGPRSGKAEILTGVLTATRSDPQVKAPAPGFYTGSRPTDGRRHGQPAHTLPPRRPPRSTHAQPARGSEPQPATAGTPAISACATIHPDELAFITGQVTCFHRSIAASSRSAAWRARPERSTRTGAAADPAPPACSRTRTAAVPARRSGPASSTDPHPSPRRPGRHPARSPAHATAPRSNGARRRPTAGADQYGGDCRQEGWEAACGPWLRRAPRWRSA